MVIKLYTIVSTVVQCFYIFFVCKNSVLKKTKLVKATLNYVQIFYWNYFLVVIINCQYPSKKRRLSNHTFFAPSVYESIMNIDLSGIEMN